MLDPIMFIEENTRSLGLLEHFDQDQLYDFSTVKII